MSNYNASKTGMSTQHQRRQSFPAPAPISTNVGPTIIATPPSANASGSVPFGYRFGGRQHPMLLHGGPPSKIAVWTDAFLSFIPRRRRQLRYPLVLCLGLYAFLIYLYFQDVTTWTAVIGFKAKNLAFNWDMKTCSYRKDPMLFVKDRTTVLVIWEMNCNLPDMDLTWVPVKASGSGSGNSSNGNGNGNGNINSIHSGSSAPYWNLNTDVNVQLNWSRHAVVAKTEITALDRAHIVYTATLSGLPQQNTNISYSIHPPRSKSHLLRSFTFAHWPSTPKYESREIARFGAISDNQRELSKFFKVLKAMTEHHKVDYLIHAGDVVQDYASLDNWQTDFASPMGYFRISQTTPLIYSHGNHDFDPEGLTPYTGDRHRRTSTSLTGPAKAGVWHAYTLAGVRFIVLDSNVDSVEQDRWLNAELQSKETRGAWFRVVVVHISPYTQYWEKEAWVNNGEREWGSFVRTRYVKEFQEYGVDLVISGHQHNYMRGQDEHMVYTIIGGAGGSLDKEVVEDYEVWRSMNGGKVKLRHHYVLIKVTGDRRLIWETYDADCGTRLDAFVLHSRTPEEDLLPEPI